MAIDNPVDAVEAQYVKESPGAPLGLVLLPFELELPQLAPLLEFVKLIGDRFVRVDRSGYPAHYSEAAHVININDVHAVERKVVKIYPILAVGVTLQVQLASCVL